MYDAVIVGGGAVGCAVARWLSRYRLRICLVERSEDVCTGTSKANSAICHAGFDAPIGSAKARFNVAGSQMMEALSRQLDFPYRRCGALVLCFDEADVPRLEELKARGERNGVEGLAVLDREALRRQEPRVAPEAVAALYAPTSAIICPFGMTIALAENAAANGCEFRFNTEVQRIRRQDDHFLLETAQGVLESRVVISAAGVYGDTLHNQLCETKLTIVPRRGEYCLLDRRDGELVQHTIFQLPSAMGKGVLVSPTVHGNLLVGPDAVRVEGDNTACTAAGLAFVSAAARRSVPSIRFGESIRNFAGVRANVDTGDFVIGEAEGAPGFIDLAGMKSPGLSSAPAVAKEVTKILKAHGDLPAAKTDYRDGRTRVRFKECSPEEKARLIAEDPAYGRVVCRCETITEGEILNALREEIPATTIDGVKRRCGAGMGRCQGGFCGPRVLELISKTLGISPLDVLQDKAGTNVLLCETKQEENHHD